MSGLIFIRCCVQICFALFQSFVFTQFSGFCAFHRRCRIVSKRLILPTSVVSLGHVVGLDILSLILPILKEQAKISIEFGRSLSIEGQRACPVAAVRRLLDVDVKLHAGDFFKLEQEAHHIREITDRFRVGFIAKDECRRAVKKVCQLIDDSNGDLDLACLIFLNRTQRFAEEIGQLLLVQFFLFPKDFDTLPDCGIIEIVHI